MTERERLASQLKDLVEAVVARNEMQVRAQIQVVDDTIAGARIGAAKAFTGSTVVQAVRYYGEFKWLWGVHQNAHALTSLYKAIEALAPQS